MQQQQHQHNESYSLMSFLAGFYTVLFMALLCASAGDTQQVLKLPVWFSWHALLCVLLVVGFDPSALHACVSAQLEQPQRRTKNPLTVAPSFRMIFLIRVLGSIAACLQAFAFAIWSTIEWRLATDSNSTESHFFALAAALLYGMGALAVLLLGAASLDCSAEHLLVHAVAALGGHESKSDL